MHLRPVPFFLIVRKALFGLVVMAVAELCEWRPYSWSQDLKPPEFSFLPMGRSVCVGDGSSAWDSKASSPGLAATIPVGT